MIRRVEAGLLAAFRRLEAVLDVAFTPRFNPLYQLGALAFLYFWIATVSGVYLFVFFDTSVSGAHASVERLTVEQWWLGGIMRSLHRYASAAMAVTVTLHLLRELGLGRFRGARAFSWISGVPLLWLLFASAIGGYILVWDQLAQYAAIATAEWLDWLPVFGDPLARNFFAPDSLSDRLFSLLVFLHIALPLFLLIGMFIHIRRLKLPLTNPPRTLLVGTSVALVAAALVHPAVSMPPADLTRSPLLVDLDWIYMNVYPLLDAFGPASVWMLLAGLTVFLVVLPRLSPAMPAVDTVAVVDPDNCNGCSWCFEDCPFEAITMIPHQHKPGMRQSQVNPDLCTGCGICVGACPSATPFRHVDELVSGIEIPAYPLERLRRDTAARLDRMPADGGTLVFGCDHAVDVKAIADATGTAAFSLPCIALLPPSFVDWVSRQPRVNRVVVTGCHAEDCYSRKGSVWMEQRISGARNPHLRTSVGRERVVVRWAGARQAHQLIDLLDENGTRHLADGAEHTSPHADRSGRPEAGP